MKKLVYAGLVIAVLIAGSLVAFYGPDDTGEDRNQPQETNQTTETETAQDETTIDFSEDGKTVSYSGKDGTTALAILKDSTEVETESSDFGEFVTSINDVKADAKTEFWGFYVNGKLASEGAGTYKTKDSDKIEWRLEKIE